MSLLSERSTANRALPSKIDGGARLLKLLVFVAAFETLLSGVWWTETRPREAVLCLLTSLTHRKFQVCRHTPGHICHIITAAVDLVVGSWVTVLQSLF